MPPSQTTRPPSWGKANSPGPSAFVQMSEKKDKSQELAAAELKEAETPSPGGTEALVMPAAGSASTEKLIRGGSETKYSVHKA